MTPDRVTLRNSGRMSASGRHSRCDRGGELIAFCPSSNAAQAYTSLSGISFRLGF